MDVIWWLAQPSHILALAVLLAALAGGLGWRAAATSLASLAALALVAAALLPLHAWIATPLESRFAAPDPLPDGRRRHPRSRRLRGVAGGRGARSTQLGRGR